MTKVPLTLKERQARWYRKQKKPKGIIYCILNKVTGERFIGKSTNSIRKVKYIMTHRCKVIAPHTRLGKNFKMYGEDCYSFIVLHKIKGEEKIDEVLKFYMKLYRPKLNNRRY